VPSSSNDFPSYSPRQTIGLPGRQSVSACAPKKYREISAGSVSACHTAVLGAGMSTVRRLSQVLGLTHSSAVRLVDRLAADGYVALS
jgi:hypothetical protein